MPLGVYAKPARAGKTGHRLSLAALLAQRPAQLPINARERVRVVLVIGVPASPMAQLWWVVGGNTVSALVGLACVAPLPVPPMPRDWTAWVNVCASSSHPARSSPSATSWWA